STVCAVVSTVSDPFRSIVPIFPASISSSCCQIMACSCFTQAQTGSMSGFGGLMITLLPSIAARRSGLRLDCQVEGSLPYRGQPQGSGLSCKCPRPQPEAEGSPPYARLGARSPAPHRFPVGSTVSCVSPLEAAKVVSGTKQKPRKISAGPIVQLTAHARPILLQSYLQYRFCWRF